MSLTAEPTPGFARGTERRAGDVVQCAGTFVNPAALGVLASLGLTRVNLFPVPRVSVLSTGNELIEPGNALEPGQIRNTNGPMLMAQIARTGGQPTYLGIARDDRASAASTFKAALANADLFVVAGGVSVGGESVRSGTVGPGSPSASGSSGGTTSG